MEIGRSPFRDRGILRGWSYGDPAVCIKGNSLGDDLQMSLGSPVGHRSMIAWSSHDVPPSTAGRSADHHRDPSQQYKSKVLAEELTEAKQTSRWILLLHLEVQYCVKIEQRVKSRRRIAKPSHVHRPVNKRLPGMLRQRKRVKKRVKNRVKNRVNRGTSWPKVMSLEMERKQKNKSVLCGHQNKMSKSQPSSRTTSCFMIWRILNIRTRKSEKICYWISPRPCFKVVSVNFHWSSFSSLFSSRICCAILLFGMLKGLQDHKWQMYPESCPSENFVCSANYLRGLPFWTWFIIIHNNVCIMSVSCILLFFWLFLFRVLKENRDYYVSDHKACADKIFRRFQSCRTDYNKISNRGKFGKSGQGQFKGLNSSAKMETWTLLLPCTVLQARSEDTQAVQN